MNQPKQPLSPAFERVSVTNHRVHCDGTGGALGHPRIYLEFGPNRSEVTCPYCSRVFVLKNH